MIIPFLSSLILYGVEDGYNADNKYGDAELTSGRYGDTYGTGSYSEYSTSRGRYSSSVEIVRYGTGESGTGYGYTAEDMIHSYGGSETAFAYVVDVLDGDVDMASSDSFYYT